MIIHKRKKLLKESRGKNYTRLKKDIKWTLDSMISEADPEWPVDADNIIADCSEGQSYSDHHYEWWALRQFSTGEIKKTINEIVHEYEAAGKMGKLVYIEDEG